MGSRIKRLFLVGFIFLTTVSVFAKSGSILLSSKHINRYSEIENTLISFKNNEEQFHHVIDHYIVQLFEEYKYVDALPVYAPRGTDKSFTISVENGKIDYSRYLLKGDLNNDLKVTWKDISLLKEALFNKKYISKFDVNKDNVLNVEDIISLVSHLNEAVYYFDFYSISGEKLSIDTRNSNNTKSFDYAGGLTQIMVVPKDINHASGFVSGLSDLNSVWYKQDLSTLKMVTSHSALINMKTGVVYTDDSIYQNEKMSKETEIVLQNLAVNKRTADSYLDGNPYLLGWKDNIYYMGEWEKLRQISDYDGGLLSFHDFFYKHQISIYKSHFSNISLRQFTTHQFPPELSSSKYNFMIGIDKGDETHFIIKTHVHTKEYFLEMPPSESSNEVTRPKIKLFFTFTSTIETFLFSSRDNKTIEVEIDHSDDIILTGKVKAHRIGPTPEELDIITETKEEDMYVFENIPYGVYQFHYIVGCQCHIEVPLKEEILIDKETSYLMPFNEDLLEVENVDLTIVDNFFNPIKDVKVEIKPKECVGDKTGTIYEEETYDDGKVYFEDVLMGDYAVYVDGEYIQDIHFCADTEQEIKVTSHYYTVITNKKTIKKVKPLEKYRGISKTLESYVEDEDTYYIYIDVNKSKIVHYHDDDKSNRLKHSETYKLNMKTCKYEIVKDDKYKKSKGKNNILISEDSGWGFEDDTEIYVNLSFSDEKLPFTWGELKKDGHFDGEIEYEEKIPEFAKNMMEKVNDMATLFRNESKNSKQIEIFKSLYDYPGTPEHVQCGGKVTMETFLIPPLDALQDPEIKFEIRIESSTIEERDIMKKYMENGANSPMDIIKLLQTMQGEGK